MKLFDDIASPSHITLYNLTVSIRSALQTGFPQPLWVTAEIASLSVHPQSGHCYLDLVEYDPSTHEKRATMRATVWARTYRQLAEKFQLGTQTQLQQGLQVMLQAKVEMHSLYGLSLDVVDINPQYTAGALQLKRQQTIEQLKRDGVFDMNRALTLPTLPKRLAVISSRSAAGYQDFMHQGERMAGRFAVRRELFPASMQGEGAPASIIAALEAIHAQREQWDAVVIIRGGGAQLDLTCFDDYNLASYVAQFPLPVVAGIGHERDTSVVDLVAHTTLKTPTAVAEFVNDLFLAQEERLQQLAYQLAQSTGYRLEMLRGNLNLLEQNIYQQALNRLAQQHTLLQTVGERITASARHTLQLASAQMEKIALRMASSALQTARDAKGQLELLETQLHALKPEAIFARGFVMVEKMEKNVKNPDELKAGDRVTIRWEEAARQAVIE